MALLYETKIEISHPIATFEPVVERFQTDSYSVRASRGINSQTEQWTVMWHNLTKSEANALRAQLKAGSVELIYWETPLESSEKPFTCLNYAIGGYPSAAARFTCTATLQREYDPV